MRRLVIGDVHGHYAGLMALMEYIGLTTRFDPNCPKPNLYGSKDVLSEIWERSLSGGMRSLGNDIADLHTFFTVRKVDRHHHFSWHGLDFQLVRVIHIHNDYHLMPSYGIFFRVADLNVFITTDTQLRLEENQRYYDEADLIFTTARLPLPRLRFTSPTRNCARSRLQSAARCGSMAINPASCPMLVPTASVASSSAVTALSLLTVRLPRP
ncbi:MAG: hypothetical protein HC838_12910 [Spirulinaceae cyanobacterium RM2_2_10]|nr:hypothetical protein [Spirulinaceae cyanobacterium RM2_2_10]